MDAPAPNPGVLAGAGHPSPADTLGWAPQQPSAAILDVIRRGQRFLVCSHSRPDGDAVGSMLAMGMLLNHLGKHADLVTADKIPAIYRTLPGADSILTTMRVHGRYDAAILLECDGAERTRLTGLDRYYLVNIDHHATGKNFGHLNWIDRGAASVGELVLRLIKDARAPITPQIATCVYVTLLTDTGGFCYGGTQASTFAIAEELTRAGADPIRIAQDIYFSVPASKLLLAGAALSHLHRDGRLAWLWVTNADIVRTCAAEEDCEGIVNYALSVSGVEAAAFFRELPDGSVRISLRGKGKVDVASIAATLGGGGHENAAGVTIDGPLQPAIEKVLHALKSALPDPGQSPASAQ